MGKASATDIVWPVPANGAAPPFPLDPLQDSGGGSAAIPVEVKSQNAEVVKNSSSVWLPVEMVVVKQLSSEPRKHSSAREIKLKQEGGEMIDQDVVRFECFCLLQNSYFEILTPKAMVLGGEGFRLES